MHSLARADDVQRPHRATGNRVLDRRDQYAQPHVKLAVHDHMGERERRGGTAHVLLHQQHRVVGLDVEPAGIEAHALADHRQFGSAGIAPVEIDQPRRACAGAARPRGSAENSVRAGHRRDDTRPRTMAAGKCRRCVLKLARPHVVCRRVDEIAREIHRFDQAAEVGRIDSRGQFEPNLVPRLAVPREPVGTRAQRRARQGAHHAAHWRSDRRRGGSSAASLPARNGSPRAAPILLPEQDPRERPFRRRQEGMPARCRLEPRCLGKSAAAVGRAGVPGAKFAPVRSIDEPDGNGALPEGNRTGCMVELVGDGPCYHGPIAS